MRCDKAKARRSPIIILIESQIGVCMQEQARVIAIVVTWNRQELLRRCLTALEAQTTAIGAIFVIDNACTDGTLEMLRSEFPDVRIRTMDKNTGGAGGWAEGLRIAQQEDWDFAWLMDDDAWASPDALGELLEGYADIQPKPTFVCSRVVDETNETINSPALLALDSGVSWDRYLSSGRLPLNACSFVSALIPMKESRRVGIPLAHYFLWMDDCEYTLRLSGMGPGWYIATSLVFHPRPFGLRNPDLLLESNAKRIPIYKHFFSNDLETRIRHPGRFGKRWTISYANYIRRCFWVLIAGGEWFKLSILTKGIALGIWRGARWRFSRTH